MHLRARSGGELLQRALDGGQVDHLDTARLLALAQEIADLGGLGVAPRADLVAGLRQRLLLEPAEHASHTPAVLRVGRRLRYVAAAAGVLLVLAASVGLLSRSSLPGDRLYPVKQLLDRVVLDVPLDDVDVGLTHLAQSSEHLADAGRLVAVVPARTVDLVAALDAAALSAGAGHDTLMDAYRTQGRTDAVVALESFYEDAVPVVDEWSTGPLPLPATEARQHLHDVLHKGQADALRALAGCTLCGDAGGHTPSVLHPAVPWPTPSSARTTEAGGHTGTNGSFAPGSTATTGTPTRADTARTATGSAPGTATGTRTGTDRSSTRPPSSTRDGGAVTPSGEGNVRSPSLGVTDTSAPARDGGVVPPVPLPTLRPPTVGVNTSGVTLGGGGVGLPDAAVSLPEVTVPLAVP